MDCLVTGCFRKVYEQNYCKGHYQRWYKTGYAGDPFPEKKQRPEIPACYLLGCERPQVRFNMCSHHHNLLVNYQEVA